jgi:hypothetical protein
MGRRTLTLGYAVAFADLVLAPFTPSNTARSGGTVFPIIRNLPPLYGSHPGAPTARRMGGYLMWTALATTCVTASMFLTGLAPNLLALEIARKTVGLEVTWVEWLTAFLPVGLLLFFAVPWLAYVFYAPEVKSGEEACRWAASELAAAGPVGPRERILAALVGGALLCWIFGAALLDPTTVALVAVVLMVLTGVVSWEDVLAHRAAWNTLAWFATLVALAGGLSHVGFVSWFAKRVADALAGAPPLASLVVLVALFFLLHYLFASAAARLPGGGLLDPGPADAAVRPRAPGLARDHGHRLPLRYRPEPGLLRQRLHSGPRFLAPRRPLRRDLPGGPADDRGALAALSRLSPAQTRTARARPGRSLCRRVARVLATAERPPPSCGSARQPSP